MDQLGIVGALQTHDGLVMEDSPAIKAETSPETGNKPSSLVTQQAGIGKGTGNRPQPPDVPPKKGPGRPPSVKKSTAPSPPEPPARKSLTDEVFLKYWRSCHNQDSSRYVVYMYRQWPVIDRKKLDPSNTKYIDIVGEPFTGSCSESILRRYGSGTYKLMLNDTTQSTCILYIGQLAYRDDDFPPVVDIRELVETDPDNRSYIAYLEQRGGRNQHSGNDQQRKKEEDDMSTNVVGPLVDTIREMVQDDRRRSDESPKQETVNIGKIVQDAVGAAMSGVTKAQELGNRIVSDASAQALAVQAKQSDPISTVREIGSLLRELSPANDNREMFSLILEQQKSFQDQVLSMQRETSQSFKDILLVTKREESKEPRTLLDTIEELRQVKQALFDSPGTSVTEVSDEASAATHGGRGKGSTDWAAMLPLILSGVGMVMNGISAAAYNYGLGQSGAMPPQPQPGNAPQPGQHMQQQPQQPFQQHRTPEEEEIMVTQIFLGQLKEPLLLALQNGENGYEFAEKLIEFHGKMAYNNIAGRGPEGIMQMLSQFPPIWTEVSKIPTAFNQFLAEFLSYEAYVAEQDAAEQSQPGSVVSGPRRVVIPRP